MAPREPGEARRPARTRGLSRARRPLRRRTGNREIRGGLGEAPRRTLPGPASTADPHPVPPLPIQVNALQALCRQVFGFRIAVIVLATPFALSRTANGPGVWLVGAAVIVTFMVSYVPLRDWERFGPVLLRHPTLLAVDSFFGALLLAVATPESILAYVTLCTPLLAGLVYSWRGAAAFAVLQSLIIGGAYVVNPQVNACLSDLLLPGLCVIAGAVGSTLRNLMLGFGTATQALTDVRARLAVNEAVLEERARLAREMHDSVAKTLHGLALAAEGLAGSADRMDTSTLKHQAELVARSARRAAAESREMLSDLRRDAGLDGGVDVLGELRARTVDFAHRSGVAARFRRLGELPVPAVPHVVGRQALTIASEAMENAQRHAQPAHLDVSAGVVGDVLRISVYDDGKGLPPGLTLDGLRQTGHFGLVGMVERAASIGARIRIGRGRASCGTEVRLELPLSAVAPQPPGKAPSSGLQSPVEPQTAPLLT
ncbi:sensor histidine kinase [Streptomyces sp. NPDC059175]|uniref:sensor histidine kinase n=1 Tax=Streptomyces sp. NPDC059175 TaxID=3346757 RepID=UPI0036B55A4C